MLPDFYLFNNMLRFIVYKFFDFLPAIGKGTTAINVVFTVTKVKVTVITFQKFM